LSIPEPVPSLALSVTVTAAPYVELEHAPPLQDTVVVGACESIFTVSEPVPVLPALSLTEQLIEWLPSPLTLAVHGLLPLSVSAVTPSLQSIVPLATPLPVSLAEMFTVTGLDVFQPFRPFAVWLAVTLGGVVSGDVTVRLTVELSELL
jgi:hypothetical protein